MHTYLNNRSIYMHMYVNAIVYKRTLANTHPHTHPHEFIQTHLDCFYWDTDVSFVSKYTFYSLIVQVRLLSLLSQRMMHVSWLLEGWQDTSYPGGGGPKVSSKGTHVTREFHTLNCPHILPKNHASTLSDAPHISKINWECHVPGGPGPAGRLAKLDRAMSLNMLLYVDTLAWPDPHYDRDVNTLRAPLRILMPRPCVALFDQYWPEGEKEYKRGLRVVLGSSIELSASTMSRAPHAAARVWSHLLSFLGFEDPT